MKPAREPQARLRYASAYGPLALSAICAFWAMILFSHYFILAPREREGVIGGYAWRSVVELHEMVGGGGLLVISAILLGGALILGMSGLMAMARLRNAIGRDALDAMRLERARERARTEVVLGSMPAHLGSVDAFRAHNRRVRLLLGLMIAVLGLVALAALGGLL